MLRRCRHAVLHLTTNTITSKLSLIYVRGTMVRARNDGRKLDDKTLEALRLRAVDAVESGVHSENAAASLRMARGTVYGWLADPVRPTAAASRAGWRTGLPAPRRPASSQS
jgi:hypothetical protein